MLFTGYLIFGLILLSKTGVWAYGVGYHGCEHYEIWQVSQMRFIADSKKTIPGLLA